MRKLASLAVLFVLFGGLWLVMRIGGRRSQERLDEAARALGNVELLKELKDESGIRDYNLDKARFWWISATPGVYGGEEREASRVENAIYKSWGAGLIDATYLKKGAYIDRLVGLDVSREFRGSVCGVRVGDPLEVAIGNAKKACPNVCVVHTDLDPLKPGPEAECFGWMLAVGSLKDNRDSGSVQKLVLWDRNYHYVSYKEK